MAREKPQGTTRQIYASIREDVYLGAKARATELRIPLREFIEMALEAVLAASDDLAVAEPAPSAWDDEYLGMQAQQPVGSPIELTKEEAERVVRASFGLASAPSRLRGPHTDTVPGG